MKESQSKTKTGTLWQKTQYSNLIRYVPSGKYFARIRVRGKLLRPSLKTTVISTAKLRLADLEKREREMADRQAGIEDGRLTFGDALTIYREQTNASHLLKPLTKTYRMEIVASIERTWHGVGLIAVQKISEKDCKDWALRYGSEYSSTRYNAGIGAVKAVFRLAIEAGAIYRNPAESLKRARVHAKHLALPTSDQFERFVDVLEDGGGRDSRNCADLVRFLAYGGFRISEAKYVTWSDCDFGKGEILVCGHPEHRTKNGTARRVPMIDDMVRLIERLRADRPDEHHSNPVMQVHECQKSMNRAATIVGMKRITHHDLRHLFATRCIESGVDIPTASRWLGHKDGGALAMKVYGHLRDEHSSEMARRVSFSKPLADNILPLPKQEAAL